MIQFNEWKVDRDGDIELNIDSCNQMIWISKESLVEMLIASRSVTATVEELDVLAQIHVRDKDNCFEGV